MLSSRLAWRGGVLVSKSYPRGFALPFPRWLLVGQGVSLAEAGCSVRQGVFFFSFLEVSPPLSPPLPRFLVVGQGVSLAELAGVEDTGFSFERAMSRLVDMQSQEYFQRQGAVLSFVADDV
jgi:hypothetical protein